MIAAIRAFAAAAVCTVLSGYGPSAFATSRPAPDWVKALEPGHWAAVSFNTLADVDPANDPEVNPRYPRLPPWSVYGQYPLLDAWNGGAFVPSYGRSGALFVAGAGHDAYFGNEIYAFDLDTRMWHRVTNPNQSPTYPVPEGIWPDGTPSLPHTYDHLEYHAGTNSFVVMRTKHAKDGDSRVTPIMAALDLDPLRIPNTNENRNLNKGNWKFSNVHPEDYAQSGGWSVYDSKRDLLWAQGGSGRGVMVSFDPEPAGTDGRFGVFKSYPKRTDSTHAAAAYDPINDIILVTTFRENADVVALDLSDPGAGKQGNVRLIQTGSPPLREQSHGWEWSSLRKSFIYWRRDAGVFELKQQGTDWRTSPWRWSELTSPSNSVVVAAPRTGGTAGPFGRFRVASYDDAEVAIVVTRVDAPVYAFRIPEVTSPRPRAPQELSAVR